MALPSSSSSSLLNSGSDGDRLGRITSVGGNTTYMKELLEAQEEYIDFLGKDIASNTAYLWAHGMEASDETVKKGEELRAKIKSLKDKLL